jgi:TRAP transporter 4TM/12TM fusion protein
MGTLSGSAIGNVVTTGSFTIPLMKRMGYSAPFAAGVEATASTGGQFMPPIMGAVAFIMAEFMGVSYLKIALAATLPAIIYFSGVFAVVHFRAVRMGLGTVDRLYLPEVKSLVLKNGYLAFPLVLIIVILALGYSIVFVAMAAIVTTFALSFIRKATRLVPLGLVSSLERSIRTAVPLSMTCACAGIIIGSVYITGLSWRLSYTIVDVSMGQLWLVLLFTMILSIVLGMGLTTSAVYITLVAIIIPVLVEMGVEPMAAHLFALYYGILSCITPPVALASYAAAGVARTSPMKAGWEASKIGLIGFFVPFLFVYGPELLLIGSPWSIALTFATAFVGCIAMAGVVEGWLVGETNWLERALLLVSSLLLMAPGLTTDLPGLGCFLLVVLLQKRIKSPLRGGLQPASGQAGKGPGLSASSGADGGEIGEPASEPEVDPELLRFLREDDEQGQRSAGQRADQPWKDYLLWGILSAAMGSFFIMGEYNLQVLYVRTWVGCLLGLSLVIVSAFWVFFSSHGSSGGGKE